MSELLKQDIRAEFAKTHSYFRTAKTLGITMEVVKDVLGQETPKFSRREAVFGGLGRPELRAYTVASKNVDAAWDNDSIEVAQARANYEAGTHEMCTGRDGDTQILYSIPRAVPTPRPGFFTVGYQPA